MRVVIRHERYGYAVFHSTSSCPWTADVRSATVYTEQAAADAAITILAKYYDPDSLSVESLDD